MSASVTAKDLRLLAQAEGYLTLEMPVHALQSLAQVQAPWEMPFEFHFLKGQVFRAQQHHERALEEFDRAFGIRPESVDLLMSMAWCYKRTAQLPKAITAMEQAYRIQPGEAVILYNLSCYWSLAGNRNQALSWLGRALRIDRAFRREIDTETDFDPIRADAEFQKLLKLFDGESPAGE